MTAKITTKNNGEVYADGILVGTVEKIVHEGLWATAYGIRAGGTEWKGTALDGTVFDGHDTRKAAAKMLARHAEPLKVENVKVDNWMGRRFIYAAVSWQGNTAIVSQYPSEDFWVVDAFFKAGSMMPAWSNGSGSRSTAAHVLKAEHAAAVNAAVEASGIEVTD